MADKAHQLTDEKLEEMESGCLPFIQERKRKFRRQQMNTFLSFPNRMKHMRLLMLMLENSLTYPSTRKDCLPPLLLLLEL